MTISDCDTAQSERSTGDVYTRYSSTGRGGAAMRDREITPGFGLCTYLPIVHTYIHTMYRWKTMT